MSEVIRENVGIAIDNIREYAGKLVSDVVDEINGKGKIDDLFDEPNREKINHRYDQNTSEGFQNLLYRLVAKYSGDLMQINAELSGIGKKEGLENEEEIEKFQLLFRLCLLKLTSCGAEHFSGRKTGLKLGVYEGSNKSNSSELNCEYLASLTREDVTRRLREHFDSRCEFEKEDHVMREMLEKIKNYKDKSLYRPALDFFYEKSVQKH